MKTKLLAILLMAITFASYAQTESGTKIIGGNAGLNFSKDKQRVGNTTTDRWKHFNVYLNPNAGLFIMDQLAVGGAITIAASSSKLDDEKYSSTTLAIGPWGRYYFPVGTKSAAFGELSTGFGLRTMKSSDVVNDRKVTVTGPNSGIIQLGIGGGYTYFVSDNVGIEAVLKYQYQRESYKEPISDERIKEMNGGLFLNIGLQFYLK